MSSTSFFCFSALNFQSAQRGILRRPLFIALFLLLSESIIQDASAENRSIGNYIRSSQEMPMVTGFQNPPRMARPLAWMWWHNGFVNKDGITKDLECFAKNGLGGVAFFDRSWKGGPDGGVRFLSEEWRDCFRHAVREASRLGLEIGFHNCAGHSESGGPWITPEESMKKFVWTRSDVRGGGKIRVELPKPAALLNYYEDAFVVAIPRTTAMPAFNCELEKVELSEGENPNSACDGCPASACMVGESKSGESVMDFFLKKPITAGMLTMDFARWISTKDLVNRFSWSVGSVIDVTVQSVGPDGTTGDLGKFQISENPLNHSRLEFPFPSTKSSHFRLVFRFGGGVHLFFTTEIAFLGTGESPLWNPVIPSLEAKLCMAPADVKDFRLTKAEVPVVPLVDGNSVHVFGPPDSEGRMELDLPEGEWTVLRFGYTTTGAINGPAELGGAGLECDKFSAESVKLHFDSFPKLILEDNKEFLGQTLTHIEIDSWECRYQNWTPKMPGYFQNLRGYDLRKYAPVFAGFVVDSPEVTERFAFDFRRTCSDLVAGNYFGTMHKLCNAYGVALMDEGLYNWPGTHNASDTLLNWGNADIPMDEFWYDWMLSRRGKNEINDSIRESASACNAYDKPVLAAESLTSMDKDYWRISPFDNKDFGDAALVQGINRFILHGSTHQADDAWPGYLGSEGQKFHRNNPWFTMSRGFIDYYARCHFLLQRGFLFADVLNFAGDSVPTDTRTPAEGALPAGYRSHLINADALIRFAGVENGKVTLPNGSRFSVLVLPDRPGMDLASLKKIEKLVSEGAVVLGPPPSRAASLLGYPGCDDAVKSLARKMWEDCDGKAKTEISYGKGRIFRGIPLADVLKKLRVNPDFEYTTDSDKRQIGCAHRRDGENEIYFVANSEDRDVKVSAKFASGKPVCELWHPESGEIFPLECGRLPDGRAQVDLELGRKEAVFVVFREKPGGNYAVSANANHVRCTTASELTGPWKLSFAPEKMKAPAPFVSQKLFRLDESDIPDVKYFSGFTTYETKFTIPEKAPVPGHRYILNLGEVHLIAEIRINGKTVGTPLWKPPYARDVTGYLKGGENGLEIVVVNYLANRLVGDAALPVNERVTWMADRGYLDSLYKSSSPLMPSGLVGPVTLGEVPAK